MKRYFLLSFVLVFSWAKTEAQNWNLVWSDEFSGSSISSANWVFETGAGGWGNSELENYTSRPENATIKNGNLLIIARKESYQGSAYTSARLKTQDLQSWTYGKVEARIKFPSGKGMWPAFWMLGSNISTVGWPSCGEIDIMEHIDTDATIEGTIHWDNNGHVQYGGKTNTDATKYHTYSVEWDSVAIKWMVDSVQYVEANIANNINSTEEFHLPFFILLNLAVGGSWPGNPDGTTVFPDTMSVDYVRVYQKALTTGLENDFVSDNVVSVYPNPATNQSTVRYSLSNSAKVSLALYDMFGKEIQSVVNETQSVGEHQYPLTSLQLSAGVYILKGAIGDRPIFYKITKE